MSFPRNHFGGGGHVNAAGGKSDLSLEDTVKRFVEILPSITNELSLILMKIFFGHSDPDYVYSFLVRIRRPESLSLERPGSFMNESIERNKLLKYS